jgi:hypothetical protein
MNLQECFDYKNQLMKDILTNKTIVHLIDETVPFEKAAEVLPYNKVFPAEYIPETLHDGGTFVMFDVDVQRTPNKTFYIPILYVWVMSHRSRLRLPEGGVRTDALCLEICKTINGSREYGLGQLDFESMKRFAPVTDYNGKQLTFLAKDFNRLYNPKAKIPSNRKSADTTDGTQGGAEGSGDG